MSNPLIDWVAREAINLAASATLGVLGGIATAMVAKFVRNNKEAAAIRDVLIPAADYWEFVYAAVREAEAKRGDGASRMAYYLEQVDVFLDECGLAGDARKITKERLKADAEGVLRALGFNRKQLPPAAA